MKKVKIIVAVVIIILLSCAAYVAYIYYDDPNRAYPTDIHLLNKMRPDKNSDYLLVWKNFEKDEIYIIDDDDLLYENRNRFEIINDIQVYYTATMQWAFALYKNGEIVDTAICDEEMKMSKITFGTLEDKFKICSEDELKKILKKNQ